MFIRDQIVTHSTLSKINQSNRVGQLSNQYYCPNGFMDKIHQHYLSICDDLKSAYREFSNDIWHQIIHSYSMDAGMNLLKELGYPKQIYSRFPTQFKYGVMTIGG